VSRKVGADLPAWRIARSSPPRRRDSEMQQDGPSANSLVQVEGLVELLFEPVSRQTRQRLLRQLGQLSEASGTVPDRQ